MWSTSSGSSICSSLSFHSFREKLFPMRREFLHMDRTAENFSGTDEAYASATKEAKAQADVLQTMTTELVEALSDTEETARRLVRQHGKKLKKRLFPQRIRGKIASYEEQFSSANEHAAGVERKTVRAKKDLERLEMERQSLELQASALHAAQRRKRVILEKVFDGSLGNEEEARIREGRDRVKKTLARAKRNLDAQSSAHQLLKVAKLDLESAVLLLNTTSTSGLGRGKCTEISRRYIIDSGSHVNVKNATKLAKIAQQNMLSAIAYNPYLPIAKKADALRGFFDVEDIGLNTVYAHAYDREDIVMVAKSTEAVSHLVTESLKEQLAFWNNAHKDVGRLERELADIDDYLEGIRSNILKQMELPMSPVY